MQKVSSSITLSIYAPIADGLLWVVPSCDFSSLFPIVKILLGIKWQFEMNVNIMFGDVMAVLYSIAFLLMELKANSTASIYSRWYRSNIVWMCTSVPVSWRKHTCNAPATFLRSFFVTCITAFRAIWHITPTTLTNKQMTFKDPMMMIRMSWRQEFYANYLCQILIVQNLLFLWLSLPAPKCLHMRFICTYFVGPCSKTLLWTFNISRCFKYSNSKFASDSDNISLLIPFVNNQKRSWHSLSALVT